MVLPGVDLTVLRSVLSLLSWQRCQCTQSALLRLAYYRYPLSRGAYVAGRSGRLCQLVTDTKS